MVACTIQPGWYDDDSNNCSSAETFLSMCQLPMIRELFMMLIILIFSSFLPREATRSAVLPWHVVRLSVCPSVTLRYRYHIRSNSAKIISRLISLTISLSADPNMTDLLHREHPQILAGIGVG